MPIEKEPENVEPEQLFITVPIRCVYDSARGGGKVRMKYEDCCVNVTEDDGEKLGSICGCLGGFVEIEHRKVSPGKVWSLSPKDIWEAVIVALEYKKYSMSGLGGCKRVEGGSLSTVKKPEEAG